MSHTYRIMPVTLFNLGTDIYGIMCVTLFHRGLCFDRLDDNPVFGQKEAGRLLGEALASMSQLCDLQ